MLKNKMIHTMNTRRAPVKSNTEKTQLEGEAYAFLLSS
jgi:hypothetical protein